MQQRVIGAGGSGCILEINREIVGKEFNYSHIEDLNREYNILSKLQNYPFFPKILFADETTIYMKNYGSSLLSKPQSWCKLMLDVFRALDRLHAMNIVHCDIKPPHIINVNKQESSIILLDYGHSICWSEFDSIERKVGTTIYLALDYFEFSLRNLRNNNNNSSSELWEMMQKSDIWAAILSVYQLYFNVLPDWCNIQHFISKSVFAMFLDSTDSRGGIIDLINSQLSKLYIENGKQDEIRFLILLKQIVRMGMNINYKERSNAREIVEFLEKYIIK